MSALISTLTSGVYWFFEASCVVDELAVLASNVQEFQEKDECTLKDYMKVACQIGTVVIDLCVFKKDWDAENIENDIKIKKGDLEKLQNELNSNKATCLQLKAMGLLTDVTHNMTNGYLIDQWTLRRMVSFILQNRSVRKEDQMNSTHVFLGIPALAGSATVTVSYFDKWYEQYGPNAPRISLNVNYDDIPDAYHTNAIFSQFICPITLEPIRFPVTAPNVTGGPDHHFERKAIIRWLTSNPTNPVNRQPLRLRNLRENVHMRQIIETEMSTLGIL